jgi:hypothetical protein
VRLASKFAKCTYMTSNKFSYKESRWGIKKRTIWRWFRIRWKCWKNEFVVFHLLVSILWAKVLSPITFFQKIFSQIFQRIQNHRQILRLFVPIWNYCEIFLGGHISTFCKLWSQTHTKRLEITKNGYCKCVLEFNFQSIKGFGLFTFAKNANA